MNNLIVNLTFGTLTVIFLIGVAIIISNAIKIKHYSHLINKKFIVEDQIKIVDLRPEWQNKLIPLLTKPILQLPAPDTNKMELLY